MNKLNWEGGLNHKNCNMYILIAAMELQLQLLLKQRINQLTIITMDKATSILMSNNDVLISLEPDLLPGRQNYTLLYDLWVTMCGFSFVSV